MSLTLESGPILATHLSPGECMTLCDFRHYIRKGHTAFAWFFWGTHAKSSITLRLPCCEEAQVTCRGHVLWPTAPAEPRGQPAPTSLHPRPQTPRGKVRSILSSFPNWQVVVRGNDITYKKAL